VELLVILAIVVVLSIGSAVVLNGRQSGAVRALLDELEGSIANAHQAAMAGSRDVAVACWGSWGASGKDAPMCIAFGDAGILAQDGGQANFIKIVEAVLAGNPPAPSRPALPEADVPLTHQQTVVAVFHYSPKDPIHRKAGIVVDGSDGWERARGKGQDILTVPPFTGEFADVLNAGNNFCKGGSSDVSQVVINGYTKRFTKTVFIKVAATNSDGGATPGGPMGLIVLLENGATVFKFYNPGPESGDGKWRRI
jgi:type II secretory pathway pseudopilin PulG